MKRLLIVDDSNIIRSKIARCLGEYGLEIAGLAANGRDALLRFQATPCDLVTMDLTMPQMDGIECIRALRALDPKVHILVVSALADKATAIQALKEGAQGFLCKPFSESELTEAIGELLSDDSND
ncbi:MAG TPA: response regulator [Accumulibacter sp.]|uniref:Chemotaxis protein CheY n=2 Tax=Candidatus Accumulibacter TaxID=327159 RepID=A0A080M0D2_9PROT|nr:MULTISPECIES: response regulator [Candidatus Accumulibacter]HNG54946.1 response regulator [Nitrospira sp.]KFB74717.1 MAG: Chemotaxis protein CheY [Candidatus Accumulibacter cognatus]MBL8399810.1 response regulator [Accumulibacter sp.]MBN8519708.1 response regulator [Accumulibacter sp.]MBO3711682.1 response regulator [Accumulibacter sp.]